MAKPNPENIRIKHKYREFLKETGQKAEASLDTVDKALARFEEYTNHKDFKLFHIQQAIGFKRHISTEKNIKSGKPLSASTMFSTMRHLKSFFQWLSREPGYKRRVSYSDADYFNITKKDTRIATAKRTKSIPTIDQIRTVLAGMLTETDVQRRDRALIAFTLLTGARDKAITSLKLKHLDTARGRIIQDARDVQTKFSKTFDSFFYPVGQDIQEIVSEWEDYLRKELLWGENDPLFPSTEVSLTDSGSTGLKREHWKTTDPVRRIFRQAFTNAGLPYYNPHSFRDTLVRFGEKICKSPEQFKAWSQNMGHESVLTTFTSYGNIPVHDQEEIFKSMSNGLDKNSPEKVDKLAAIKSILEEDYL